jgi:anti-sigma regulatory factor (Ser/Thr protein kinase)
MTLLFKQRLRNDRSDIRQVAGWVEEFSRRASLPPAARNAFDLALEEWVTNVISYAFGNSSEHWIELRFLAAPGEARVEIQDDGREFNPLTHPPVDTKAPLETRPIGGLGIHMMRQLMDGVEYRREGGRNHVALVKRWS